MSSSAEAVLLQKRDNIAWITLNRPAKLNALNIPSWDLLYTKLDEADKDPEVRVIVLTGAGRGFCAGDDINELVKLKDAEAVTRLCSTIMRVFEKLEVANKPIIAAVNGIAYGGGFEIATACDLVVAAYGAKFAQPEARIGAWPFYAVLRLVYMIGRAKTFELLMTGEPISAEEAKSLGLVNKIVPPEQLVKTVEEYAKKIMASAPMSLSLIRRVVNRRLAQSNDVEIAVSGTGHLFLSEDAHEGARAFLEKRQPRYLGR